MVCHSTFLKLKFKIMADLLSTTKKWNTVFEDQKFIFELTKRLTDYMNTTRWYAAKTEEAKNFKIVRKIGLHSEKETVAHAITIEVNFAAGFTENYFMNISFCENIEIDPKGIVCEAEIGGKKGIIIDSLFWEDFRKFLFKQITKQQKFEDEESIFFFEKGKMLRSATEYENSRLLGIDQSNTSIEYNGKYYLKIFRRLFQDVNPDLELTKYLSDDAGFKNAPSYACSISWKKKGYSIISVGLMQGKIENQGEAWSLMLRDVKSFFERIDENKIRVSEIENIPLFERRKIKDLDDEIVDLIGFQTLKNVQKIATRVAEMHIALFKNRFDTSFNPIAFNSDYSVWLKNRIIYQFNARHILVEQNIENLSGLAREYAEVFLASRDLITSKFLAFDETLLNSQRIRIHGDLHLGQILATAHNDFYIIDFEGEPESTIRDRKVKQTPLKDVAGILRSFHYAVYAVIFDKYFKTKLSEADLFVAGEKYYQCIISIFLRTYLDTAMTSNMDVGYYPEIVYLLKYHLLEKAIYEIGYELKSRPDWVIIPLTGIKQILDNK
jgi:trehalose synthase-fused probable maltokinase